MILNPNPNPYPNPNLYPNSNPYPNLYPNPNLTLTLTLTLHNRNTQFWMKFIPYKHHPLVDD